jgi:ATP-binding cassette subfamily F protein 3
MKQFEKQQGEIAKMEEFVQKNLVRASTTKRAQSRRKALDKMERLDKPLGDLKRAHFSFEVEQATGKEVLNVQDVAVSYDGRKPLISQVTFQLRRGDTAALIGPNGIGKSTLLKALMGQQPPSKGSIDWGANVRIGYYDQEQSGLNTANSIIDEVWNEFPHIEEARIRKVLGSFLFSGEDVFKKISALSGGEKARVALAKLMLEKANVLILDEPTNHLDLYSREVLESALIDYDGTLLFISHDRYFLNKIAESMLELTREGITSFLGNYDDYVEKKPELAEIEQQRLALEAAKSKSSNSAGNGGGRGNAGNGSSGHIGADPSGGDYESAKLAKREDRARQRKLELLEQDIARLEEAISAMEADLAKPEIFNDYVRVQQTNEAMEASKSQLADCYEQWEQLAE